MNSNSQKSNSQKSKSQKSKAPPKQFRHEARPQFLRRLTQTARTQRLTALAASWAAYRARCAPSAFSWGIALYVDSECQYLGVQSPEDINHLLGFMLHGGERWPEAGPNGWEAVGERLAVIVQRLGLPIPTCLSTQSRADAERGDADNLPTLTFAQARVRIRRTLAPEAG